MKSKYKIKVISQGTLLPTNCMKLIKKNYFNLKYILYKVGWGKTITGARITFTNISICIA